ncbi:MAG: hypothetical protein ACPW60_03640 [Methylohalobius sp. ZOD2]
MKFNHKHLLSITLLVGVVCSAIPTWGKENNQALVKELLNKLEERDRKLAERDALINDLQRRVTHLERLVVKPGQETEKTETFAQSTKTKNEKTPSPSQSQVAQAEAAPKPKPKPDTGPGSFEVDEEAAERALERTLTQTGALLLPFGRAEIQPFFTYTRQEIDNPNLITVNGDLVTGRQEIRLDQFESGVFSRLGLPMETQLELRVPYTIVDRSTVNNFSFVGGGRDETKSSGSRLGDIRLGLAKTLFREQGWRPDLIARLTWTAPTGRRFDDGVSLSGGFHRLEGSLTALKRQDPLAFTGRFFYNAAFDDHGNNPGDRFGFSVGAFLAASPETSLSISLEQSFIDEVKLNGRIIEGSDRVSSSFILGASSILGRGFLLSVFGGIGLTEDAPDYFINISVPLRFNVPFVR